jgi:hypothetical protein
MAHEEASPTDAPTVVQQILSVIPGGCTWLLPVRDDRGEVVDFRVAAAGGLERDLYGRCSTVCWSGGSASTRTAAGSTGPSCSAGWAGPSTTWPPA